MIDRPDSDVPDPEGEGALTVSPETVCTIVMKAREFDVKEGVSEPDPGSNPTDDDARAVLADYADDATYQELAGAIESLNRDERIELVALAWLGRGDFDTFEEARREAAATRDRHMPGYLIGMPLLAAYLEEGLSQLGHSCQEFEAGHL